MKMLVAIVVSFMLCAPSESIFPLFTSSVTQSGPNLRRSDGPLQEAFSKIFGPVVNGLPDAKLPIFVGTQDQVFSLLQKFPQLKNNVHVSDAHGPGSQIPVRDVNQISNVQAASVEDNSNDFGMPYGYSVPEKPVVSYGHSVPKKPAVSYGQPIEEAAPGYGKPAPSYSKPVSSYAVPEAARPSQVAVEEPQPVPEMQDLPTVNESSWISQVSSSESSTSSHSESTSSNSSFSSSTSITQTVSNNAVESLSNVSSESSQSSTQTQAGASNSNAVLQNVSVQQSIGHGSNSDFFGPQLPVVPSSPSFVSDNVIRPASRVPSTVSQQINSSQSDCREKVQEKQSRSSEDPQFGNLDQTPPSENMSTNVTNQVSVAEVEDANQVHVDPTNVVVESSENATKTFNATPVNSDQTLEPNSTSDFSTTQLPAVQTGPSFISENVIRPASRVHDILSQPIVDLSQSQLGQQDLEKQSGISESTNAMDVVKSPTSEIASTDVGNQVSVAGVNDAGRIPVDTNDVVGAPSENATKTSHFPSESETSLNLGHILRPSSNSAPQLHTVQISPSFVSDKVIRPASRVPRIVSHPVADSSRSEPRQQYQDEPSKLLEIPQPVNVVKSPISDVVTPRVENQVDRTDDMLVDTKLVIAESSESSAKLSNASSESDATTSVSNQIIQANHQQSEKSFNQTQNSNEATTRLTNSTDDVSSARAADGNHAPEINLAHPFMMKARELTSSTVVGLTMMPRQTSRRATNEEGDS